MKCDEVRELLPAYVDGELHPAGEFEAHLASCAACSDELAAYRAMIADLAGLRDRGEEPRPELLERTLALIPTPSLGERLLGSIQTHPVAYGVASVGAMGATTMVLMWRRRRRAVEVSAS